MFSRERREITNVKNNVHISIRQAQTFLLFMEHRKIKAVADKLPLTPQAVSKILKIIEERLNENLFDRSKPNRVIPLPRAFELMPMMKDYLNSHKAMASSENPDEKIEKTNPKAVKFINRRVTLSIGWPTNLTTGQYLTHSIFVRQSPDNCKTQCQMSCSSYCIANQNPNPWKRKYNGTIGYLGLAYNNLIVEFENRCEIARYGRIRYYKSDTNRLIDMLESKQLDIAVLGQRSFLKDFYEDEVIDSKNIKVFNGETFDWDELVLATHSHGLSRYKDNSSENNEAIQNEFVLIDWGPEFLKFYEEKIKPLFKIYEPIAYFDDPNEGLNYLWQRGGISYLPSGMLSNTNGRGHYMPFCPVPVVPAAPRFNQLKVYIVYGKQYGSLLSFLRETEKGIFELPDYICENGNRIFGESFFWEEDFKHKPSNSFNSITDHDWKNLLVRQGVYHIGQAINRYVLSDAERRASRPELLGEYMVM